MHPNPIINQNKKSKKYFISVVTYINIFTMKAVYECPLAKDTIFIHSNNNDID